MGVGVAITATIEGRKRGGENERKLVMAYYVLDASRFLFQVEFRLPFQPPEHNYVFGMVLKCWAITTDLGTLVWYFGCMLPCRCNCFQKDS